jgi:uncharacterized protein YbcI
MLVFLVIMEKSKGQLEDSIAKEISRFYMEALGTGARESKAYILDDLVIVRLKGKLLPIEQKLLEGEQGVAKVKNLREQLHQVTTPGMNDIIKKITGREVISTHSDISTKTGELLKVFVISR